jgi:D-methionine transport system substrate-binding protein
MAEEQGAQSRECRWHPVALAVQHDEANGRSVTGQRAVGDDPGSLERAGKLTFKPGVNPWEAKVTDIAKNIGGYKFMFVDYGAGPRVLDEVDAVIAYNMQFISAGTDQKDKIYAPPAPLEFAGQLVVGTSYLDDPQIRKLIKVFSDPRVQHYLATTQDPDLKDQLSQVSKS